MSISRLSSNLGTYLPAVRNNRAQPHKEFAVRPAQEQASAAAPAAAAASPAASAGSGGAGATAAPAHDNYALRQALFGIKPPVLTDAPDADGRTGSYRALVEGIDPTIQGNPGYADRNGLGGTAAAQAQVERNRLVNSLQSNIKTA